MRHLLITQDYGPDLGGIARRHVELCRRFSGDDEVTVSTVASPGGAAFDAGEAYRITRQPFPFSQAKRFLNQMRWSQSLVGASPRPDVLHLGNLRPCGYAVWLAARRTGRPYVAYVYGGDVLREQRKAKASVAKRTTARAILGAARGIVAISDWTATQVRVLLAALDVTRPPPVAVIALGTDPLQFNPAHDRGALRQRLGLGRHPLLLTVARLVPHKGQDITLRALAALVPEFPDLHYLVVGEGADKERLRGLAASLGVGDRVVFAGALSDAETAEAYATATVYVGLSRVDSEVNAEGFGISFVEAGASGIPVVAGDSGGVRAAVRDGVTGFVVPPTDVEAVVATLRPMLGDEVMRRTVGAAGRRAVEQHYNWDRVARETIAFARDVCAASVGSAR